MNKKRMIILVVIGIILLAVVAIVLALLLNRGAFFRPAGDGGTESGTRTGNEYDEIVQTGNREDVFGPIDENTQPKDPAATTDTAETDATNVTNATNATDAPETEPAQDQTLPTEVDAQGNPQLTYEQYMALSGDKQQELFDRYFADDPLTFAVWFQQIKKKYDEENPEVIVTGPIDFGDIINSTNP